MKKGLVFDIDRFSSHDGPGIRAAVFLKGCPISCVWCHSPESQKKSPELVYQNIRCAHCLKCVGVCANKAVSEAGSGIKINRELCKSCFLCAESCAVNALRVCGGWLGADEIFETVVMQDKPFYENSGGGVTVTGGEPLMQAEFTRSLLEMCKKAGIHTAIETCGFGSRKALLQIAEYCDLIYYDIKLTDEELHKKYTGAGNALILRNLSALCETAVNAGKIIIRIPCIPGINDSPEQIAEISRLARDLGITHIEPMPYNAAADAKYAWLCRSYKLAGTEQRDRAYFDNLKVIINKILGDGLL
ncbi:MAG: glycyl-radical enzyme activating protein [Oscillospiraceae bacterium]|nr:glycyl-radical enzyme activating protein [Oscillospiraceae bacterium]